MPDNKRTVTVTAFDPEYEEMAAAMTEIIRSVWNSEEVIRELAVGPCDDAHAQEVAERLLREART